MNMPNSELVQWNSDSMKGKETTKSVNIDYKTGFSCNDFAWPRCITITDNAIMACTKQGEGWTEGIKFCQTNNKLC